MFRPTPLLIALLPVLISPAGLHGSLESARQAQAMLGPDTWSRILEIRNERPGVYPAQLYATVFEFNRILWFYAAVDGTQSLSLFLGQAEKDKTELGPLLRKIDRGFTSFDELPDRAAGPPSRTYPPLANGCFIESLHELQRRIESGERIHEAALLAIYYDVPSRGIVGHTGLVYSTEEGRFFWDPLKPKIRRRVPENPATPAGDVATWLYPRASGRRVDRARYVNVPLVALTAARFAKQERKERRSESYATTAHRGS